MTPMSPEGYAATGGCCCPACGSTDLAHGRCDSEGAQSVTRRWACEGCAAVWTAVYELVGYEGLLPQREEAP